MSRRTANLITLAALGALFAAVTLSAPWWARLLRQDAAVEDEGSTEEPAAGASRPVVDEPGTEAQRSISVRLYFDAAEWNGLVPEERQVQFSSDLAAQIRTVLEELVKGSTTGLQSPLAADTKVLGVFVTARGTAYVSLSPEAAESGLGTRSELDSVYAVVNTVAANFPAVKRVQLLIADREALTLSGHVDISKPLLPDMSLVAGPPSPPPASPGAAPSGASPAP